MISSALTGTRIVTPVIINDQVSSDWLRTAVVISSVIGRQVGLSRATTACVIACLFKEFQITASFDGLLHTVPGVNCDILKMDNYVMDPSKVA